MRNIAEESEELYNFLQIVQEISECGNSAVSTGINVQFVKSIEDAFKRMNEEQDWRNLTSPLLDLINCRDILIKLTAHDSIALSM